MHSCLGYDIKLHLMVRFQFYPFGGGVTLSSPLLPAPLSIELGVTFKVPSMGQIELFNRLLRFIIIDYLKPFSYEQMIYCT